jgi:hypothetical protein
MSWLALTTSLVPTLLILSASLAWWFTEPKNARINLIAAAGLALFCWAVAPELCRDLSYSAYALTADAVAALRLDLVLVRNAKMLVTGVAVVWYVGLGFVLCVARCRAYCFSSYTAFGRACNEATVIIRQYAYCASLQAGPKSVADAVETGPRIDQHPGCRRPRSARCVASGYPARCRHRQLDARSGQSIRPEVSDTS